MNEKGITIRLSQAGEDDFDGHFSLSLSNSKYFKYPSMILFLSSGSVPMNGWNGWENRANEQLQLLLYD